MLRSDLERGAQAVFVQHADVQIAMSGRVIRSATSKQGDPLGHLEAVELHVQ